MSIDSALQRVTAIHEAISNPAALVGGSATLTGGTSAPASVTATTTLASSAAGATPVSFAAALRTASIQTQGSGPEAQLLASAESQIGQAEQPPGSNESPAIAEYRAATAGAMPGAPWCAYFASWAARQAGEPLGDQGQGLGSVSAIWSWAQSSGRAIANAPGTIPKPGDLIVFGGEHVGIVKAVLPDGRIQTVEGNYNDQVSLNVRGAGEASGYVSMS